MYAAPIPYQSRAHLMPVPQKVFHHQPQSFSCPGLAYPEYLSSIRLMAEAVDNFLWHGMGMAQAWGHCVIT